MRYIKAEDILPVELIQAIQQYVDGSYIYIPRKSGSRRSWGQQTAYKSELQQRNRNICEDASHGVCVSGLCEKYHLSEKSIRRILRETMSRE